MRLFHLNRFALNICPISTYPTCLSLGKLRLEARNSYLKHRNLSLLLAQLHAIWSSFALRKEMSEPCDLRLKCAVEALLPIQNRIEVWLAEMGGQLRSPPRDEPSDDGQTRLDAIPRLRDLR